MNNIIWKSIDSTTINGLIICELPPITKPKMRVKETEVDGVDGSIIEELGYESYDKSITIGLYGNYDINKVIEYFTGEGKISFSNEPDKYYNAKIIEQIDYERLLRYRTAKVKFRIQPFKYELDESKSNILIGEILGKSIYTNNTNIIDKLTIYGETIQTGAPSPETQAPFQSIDGTLELQINDRVLSIFLKLNELRSLNNIKDELVLENGNITLIKKLYQKVLKGTEKWVSYGANDNDTYTYYWAGATSFYQDNTNVSASSDYFEYKGAFDCPFSEVENKEVGFYLDTKSNQGYIYIVSTISTLEEFKNWLTSNNVTIIYELKPSAVASISIGTYTEPLFSSTSNQITNDKNATMKISGEGNNINNIIVKNNGNTISKPIIIIKGTGTIEFILNGNALFKYTFPDEEEEVVIDSEEQDAYLGNVLRNRNMVGEFPLFNVGNNTISWSGNISNIEILKKSRWL